MQRLIRLYREETGQIEVDMHDVARFALRKGMKWPKPPSPVDLLAKQFTQAARTEIRQDSKTGRPYRANHAVPVETTAGQLAFVWVDIDDPSVTRPIMRKSLIKRREQMVDDGVQLCLDADHWNSLHPAEEPIMLPMDFELDVQIRKAASGEADEAA
jgi:hypothetical protein